LRWPLDAYIVSSEFGERWGKLHKGMDMAADVGEPVYAIADGDVIYAGDGLRGYGNVIILRHDRKTSSLYAHNNELKVKQGDHVTQGTLIALLGSTGHSTGPHVHFEIRDGDTAVNPRAVLPKPKVADALQPPARAATAANWQPSTPAVAP
jgi:murein DD-endopeptidase MepM/ murein hydrolase activator NlpD